MVSFSCSKKQLGTVRVPPSPFFFEIIDKDGKSLVTSLKDSVKVNYVENGTTKSYNLIVNKLYATGANGFPDTTKLSAKYNGLFVHDQFIGVLSSRESSPIRNFEIYLNGKDMGTIYLYLDYGEKTLTATFTFKNIPIAHLTAEGLPIYLLPVQ
jgi:hypothetical protein